QAAPRAGSEPAHVIRNFHERSGKRFERAAGKNNFVMRGKGSEFVRMRPKRESCEFRDFSSGAFGKFGMCVEARADGGATDRQIVETIECNGDTAAIAVKQIHPAGKFLVHGERSSVLQVRAADFYDAGKLLSFRVECISQFFYRGQKFSRSF